MKTSLGLAAVVATLAMVSAVRAEDPKQTGPGTTGEMNKVAPNGVATDPGQVKAQQGSSAKASPGTVGAAPSADTKSQTGK